MEGIKRHGRWRSDVSVTRYTKHARVLHEASKLPEPVRQYALVIERSLVRYLSGELQAPRPPFHRPQLSRIAVKLTAGKGLRR